MMSEARYNRRYRAVCSNCGYVELDDPTPVFITRFALPSWCSGCNEYPDWQVETRIFEKVKKPFHILSPSSWVSRWSLIETKKEDAPR